LPFYHLQTSYRGRKALNLGGVVSPRAKQSSKAANSPVPAAVPQQSPNTISSVTQQTIQQQPNLIGVTTTPNTPQQPQQQSQQQIPTTTTHIMKEHHQQPMVSLRLIFIFSRNYQEKLEKLSGERLDE
jgi:hypothetical protein